MSLVAASRSSRPSRSILSSLFSRTSCASAFFDEGRRGFDGDFLVDIFVLFWLFQDYCEEIIHRRDAEFAWFDKFTMSGIRHKPFIQIVERCVLCASARAIFESSFSGPQKNSFF